VSVKTELYRGYFSFYRKMEQDFITAWRLRLPYTSTLYTALSALNLYPLNRHLRQTDRSAWCPIHRCRNGNPSKLHEYTRSLRGVNYSYVYCQQNWTFLAVNLLRKRYYCLSVFPLCILLFIVLVLYCVWLSCMCCYPNWGFPVFFLSCKANARV
jgi:hypothetical protein